MKPMPTSLTSRFGKGRLVLMPRDHLLLAEVGNCGVLPSSVIQQRHWPNTTTPRACQERLRKLTDAGFLHVIRPPVISGKPHGGAQPILFALTMSGADLIEEHTSERPKRASSKLPTAGTIYHRADIASVVLNWNDACERNNIEQPKWILEQDTRDDLPPDVAPVHRRVLFHKFQTDSSSVTCRPDAASRTKIVINGAECDLIMFWEVDRSTEDHKQLLRKLPGYEQLLQSAAYARYFKNSESALVRIMWVCKSKQRIANMRAKFKHNPIGREFRFGVLSEMRPTSTLNASIWNDIDGRMRSILKQSVASHE